MEQELMVSELAEKIREGIRQEVFAGAVVHVRKKGQRAFFEAFGDAESYERKRKMEKDMLFDLASLTKVMATLPAILRTVQLGKLKLSDPIREYLGSWKEWSGSDAKGSITVEHLLTHTSGLPAWRPYYLSYKNRTEYVEAICEEPLEYPTGSQVVYSDIGFMLLGFLLEHVWQKPLTEVYNDLVFQPLNLKETRFLPVQSRESIVATEVGNQCEYQMCQDYIRDAAQRAFGYRPIENELHGLPWRKETICGETNDGNAYYGLQGVSGHAGLFSTAQDVARYLHMWRNGGEIDGSRFLDHFLVQEAVSNKTLGQSIARGLGFEVAPQKGSSQWAKGCSAGPAAPEGAFGHTGFTGTSMWVDPVSDTEVVLLTNRIHPKVTDGIKKFREQFHRTAFLL